MEDYLSKSLDLRRKAGQSIEKAEYLLTKLYPSVNDPKLLIAFAENIFLALSYSLGALLNYELKFNRIPIFKEDFDGKYDAFDKKVALRYGFDKTYNHLMIRIRDLIMKHKDSPVEFARKNKYVICDDKYDAETLSQAKCMMYLDKTKDFYKKVYEITDKEEHIFGMRSQFKREERRKRYI